MNYYYYDNQFLCLFFFFRSNVQKYLKRIAMSCYSVLPTSCYLKKCSDLTNEILCDSIPP